MKIFYLFFNLFHLTTSNYINGINWYGFETDNYCLLGLNHESIDYYLNLLYEKKMNSIRLPISLEIVYNNNIPNSWLLEKNQQYTNQNFHYILNDFFIKSEKYNISIIIDFHRLNAGKSSPLWYNSNYTENDLINGYHIMIQKYGNYSNFLGIDLFNEPHYQATWGSYHRNNDWKLYIEKVLTIFETSYSKPFYVLINGIDWGKNFSLIQYFPLHENNFKNFKNYIIYSPHLYGPSLNYIPSYDKHKLFQYWNRLFGFIPSNQIWIGEWGGQWNETLDKLWIDIMIEYFHKQNITNHYFWALNPDSKDVDGLLNDDWITINENIYHSIQSIQKLK